MAAPDHTPFSPIRVSMSAWTLNRERWAAVLLGLAAIPAGMLVGQHPVAMLFAVTGCVLLAACAFMPMRLAPALLLVGTAVMPTLVLKGLGGSGQARLVDVVVVFVLVRALFAKRQIAVPRIFPLAIAAAVGLTLGTAVVALTRPAYAVGTTAQLTRDLSFPFAAIIGLLGADYARTSGRWLAIPRSFAVVGILASLAGIDYWAWQHHGFLPLSHSLFSFVQGNTTFSGRSVFPFVADSPDLGAAVYMMLAAFAAPPLLLAGGRRDRVLALVLLALAFAAMLSTESRTGLAGAVVGAVTYLVLIKRAHRRRLPVILTLLVLAVAGGYAISTYPAERFTGDTLSNREGVWQQAFQSFRGSPIIGHGYLYSEAGNYIEGLGRALSVKQSVTQDVLSALVDGGVIGATVFVGILVAMVRLGLRALRDQRLVPVAIGYLCLLAVFLVTGIFDSPSQSAACETIEWLTFGIMVGLTPGLPGGRPADSPISPPARPVRI